MPIIVFMRTLVIAAFLSSVFAQSAPTLQFRGQRPSHATVAASPADLAVTPGTKVPLFVDVTPHPKIHVYAPGAKDFIPITMKLEPAANVKVGKLVYPQSQTMTFADEKVPVFEKPFRLTQEITVDRSVKPGTKLAIAGKVDFQACEDTVCFPPESANVGWTLTVR